MQVESRSYNPDSTYRPKPYLMEQPDAGLLLILTSWTTQAESEKAGRLILEQIQKGFDTEATRLPDQTGLIEERGRLTLALSACAQTLYKQSNQKQARLLIEALVLQVQGGSLAWAQVGGPNLYLLRQGRMAPLAVQPDHSLLEPGLPPLPSTGLGLEAQTPIQSGAVRFNPEEDRLLCLAQSWDPGWPVWPQTPSFADITHHLIQRNSQLPYWCALVQMQT